MRNLSILFWNAGGVDYDELTEVCQISYDIPTLIRAETMLTIIDVNYFNANVTIFTCHGSNDVDNYINSPETDSVELTIVGEFPIILYSDTNKAKFTLEYHFCVW